VFEYDSPFWNIFKSLSTYILLAETEAISQFVFGFYISNSNTYMYNDIERLYTLHSFFTLSLIRWFVFGLLYWKGINFLAQIVHSRRLPSSTYVSSQQNLVEYAILHLIANLYHHSLMTVLSLQVIFMDAYFTIRYFVLVKKKKRFCKQV